MFALLRWELCPCRPHRDRLTWEGWDRVWRGRRSPTAMPPARKGSTGGLSMTQRAENFSRRVTLTAQCHHCWEMGMRNREDDATPRYDMPRSSLLPLVQCSVMGISGTPLQMSQRTSRHREGPSGSLVWVQEDPAQQQLVGGDVPARGHTVGLPEGAAQTKTEQRPPGPTCAHTWLCHEPLTPISSQGSAGVGRGLKDCVVPHFWGLEPCDLPGPSNTNHPRIL